MNMQAQIQAAIDAAASSTPECAPATDVAAPATVTPVRQLIEVKPLNEKAILVKLKRSMYQPNIRDEKASERYGAGNVTKKLFDGNNPVKHTLSKFTSIYTFVNDNTVPWETGVRMLKMTNWDGFTRKMRELTNEAYAAVDTLCSNWANVRDDDYQRMRQLAVAKNNPDLADLNDYPDVVDLRSRFSIDVRYMPIPTTDAFDPRFGMSDEEKASLQRQLDDVQASAASHVLEQMLEPMQRFSDKLAVPIGEDGSFFRDSLLNNLTEVADRMNRVNLSDDPVIQKQIDGLKGIASQMNKDVLRNSQNARNAAKARVDTLMTQMKGLV